MPNVLNRHKIKDTQRISTASQSSTNNVYCMEPVSMQQITNSTQKLAKLHSEASEPISSISMLRKLPRTTCFFRRNRNCMRDKKLPANRPFFPEEEHRRQMERYAIYQLNGQIAEAYHDHQPSVPLHQSTYMNCNKYIDRSPYDFQIIDQVNCARQHQASTKLDEESRKCQHDYKVEMNKTLNNNITNNDLKWNRDSSHNQLPVLLPTVSNLIPSNQHVVPTQSVNLSHGYSTKIKVLAQPLKTGNTCNRYEEVSGDGDNTIVEYLKEEPIDQQFTGTGIMDMYSQKFVEQGDAVRIKSTMKKNRISFLTKIARKIKRKKFQPTASILRIQQTSPSPINDSFRLRNVQSRSNQVDFSLTKNESRQLLTPRKQSETAKDIVRPSNVEVDETRDSVYSAQEILSPRQLVSSMTDVCSTKKISESNTQISSHKEVTLQDKINDLGNDSSRSNSFESRNDAVNVAKDFQNVFDRLERTLQRCCTNVDAERKLLGDILTSQLNRYGTKMDIYEKYVAELMEKENKDKSDRRDNTIFNEGIKNEASKVRTKVAKEESSHDCSSKFFVCKNCELRNANHSVEDSNLSRSRDSVTDLNHLQTLQRGSYSWKELYQRDLMQNSYVMIDPFENNQMILNSQQQQQWSHQDRISQQEDNLGCVTSRSSRTYQHSKNVENLNHIITKHQQAKHQDHPSIERNFHALLFHENNCNHYADNNSSAPTFNQVYLDLETEATRGCGLQTGNLKCCGLVMYDQKDPNSSLIRGQCCNPAIPVCGTVSQGVSPRYEPNFTPPPYYEQDPVYEQQALHKRRYEQRIHRKRTKPPHHYYCHHDRRRDAKHSVSESDNTEEERESTNGNDVSTEELRHFSNFSSLPLLKSLTKTTNTILTSIFGRSTIKPQSTKQQQNKRRVSRGSTVRPRRK